MRKITKEIFNLLEGSSEKVRYDDEILQYLYDETTYDVDRYGKVQNIDFPDYDYFNDYIMDIDKNVYDDAKKRLEDLLNNVKFYSDSEGSGTYLELSDNHTMYNLDDNGKSEEEWYSIIDSKSVEFENETNVPLRFLGRSARHICVDINLSNIVNYDKLKEVQNRLEDEAIAEFNGRELESTINESEDNSLASEISKYIRDNFNINPEIDFNPNSTSSDIKKYLNTIKSGIKLFDKSGISVDKIVIGYHIASDNGVLNNKYDILFTVDAAGSKINSFILSHSVINVDEIGRELFNIKSLSKQLSNSGGKDIFKKSMNKDWVLEGTKDNLMLYYVGHNREKAIYKIIELESTSSRVNEGSEVKSQSGIVEESEDIEERRTRGIDKSIERLKSEIDRVDREHKSCTDEERGKKLADRMEDLVTRLNKLEAYKETSLKEDANLDKTAEVANFIKDSVDKLQTTDYTNSKYNLDDTFAIYVGWSDGYEAEETNDLEIHSKENPTYAINALIGVRNDADYADLDSIVLPYFDSGDVYECQYTISPNEDYNSLANNLLKDYSDIKEKYQSGEILIESSLEEDINKTVIRNYADSDGEIDLDVTDDEIDILVAFSFDFNDSDDSYYSQFMNILANNVEVVSFNNGILTCKFSDYFKKYNSELASLFEIDEEEAYTEVVADLESLLPGFAGEEIYKKLVDILKGINESSDNSGKSVNEIDVDINKTVLVWAEGNQKHIENMVGGVPENLELPFGKFQSFVYSYDLETSSHERGYNKVKFNLYMTISVKYEDGSVDTYSDSILGGRVDCGDGQEYVDILKEIKSNLKEKYNCSNINIKYDGSEDLDSENYFNESSDSYEQKRISDNEAYDRYMRNHPEELNYDLYSQPMEVIDEINSGIYGMTWDELLNDYEENPESDAYIDIIREAKKSLWLKNHINK